jgi:hypothetical protein
VNKLALALLGLVFASTGCAEPNVRQEPVPGRGNPNAPRREYEREKPLPDQRTYWEDEGGGPPPPPFEDVPLVTQRTPEQGQFERAYRGVGKPRITIFVNRTLDGEIVPTEDYHGGRSDRGNGYLRSDQYDGAKAKVVDYEAMENILTDFLACQGSVEIMSPTMARQKLTDEQIKDLQSGKPRVLREIAQQLESDILVQVTAKPTRQTASGLEVRLVGEALNTKGGQQIGRAVVDIKPPLEKTTLNKYTRYIARKLMMDMTQAWSSAEPAPAEKAAPRGGEEPKK